MQFLLARTSGFWCRLVTVKCRTAIKLLFLYFSLLIYIHILAY